MLDTLFINARVYTQSEARPIASAFGVHRGRVVCIDDELPREAFREVVDLGGRTVVPGFHDAHLHLTHIGLGERQVDLGDAATPTMRALLERVGEACAQAQPGDWVVGEGYHQDRLGGHPTAEQLDAVSAGHPVFLVHTSRHMGVANTEAFAHAGFPDRRAPEPPEGGSIPRDAQGRALGLLEETAQSLIKDVLPKRSADDVAAMVAAGSRRMLSLGVTSITEPGLGAPDHIGMSRVDLAGYQLAADRNELGVRAHVMPYFTTLHEIGERPVAGVAPLGLDLGIRTGWGSDRLRLGPVKLLSDGSLIGRSAFMCCDYAVEPGNHGYLQFSETTLRESIIGAHLGGWQVAVHALGDAALEFVLDTFAEAQRVVPRPDARHRIEHLGVASDAQIARVRELGLVPVPQGRFVSALGDEIARAMGDERSRLTYRIGSLLRAGIEVPGSTDAPVVDPEPFANIDAMVNRRTASGAVFGPDERITVSQAIRAYTVGSAYAVHREHELGSIAHDYLADFLVLDRDPYSEPSEQIADTRVAATFVGGGLVAGEL